MAFTASITGHLFIEMDASSNFQFTQMLECHSGCNVASVRNELFVYARGNGSPRFSALALTSYRCGLVCGAGECSEVLLCRRIVGSRDTNDALFLKDALITRLQAVQMKQLQNSLRQNRRRVGSEAVVER